MVDDGSRDGTADVARAHGARVVAGTERRRLGRQAVGAAAGARGGVRRDRRVARRRHAARGRAWPGALAGALEDADLVTASARFVCERPGERLLHPSMLASLVYRYGPSDADAPVAPGRVLANGQVTAVRRDAAAGGGRLRAGRGAHDRRRRARAGARPRGLAGRVRRRHGARRGADVRVGARDVARVGALDRAARRDAAGLAGGRPRRGVAGDGAARRAHARRPAAPARPGAARRCGSRCWHRSPAPTRAAARRTGSRRSPTRRRPSGSRCRRCVRGASGAGGPIEEEQQRR